MWYLKLQTHINLLLTSTSFPTISHIITFLTTKGIEIYKILNLSCCQIITFKTNFNEYFISALRPTHRGLGCNAYHSNFYLLTLPWFYSYVTTIIFPTNIQSFVKDKPTTKYQKDDLIQSLEATRFYISRGGYTVILNNIRELYNIISLILSSKLQKSNSSNRVLTH